MVLSIVLRDGFVGCVSASKIWVFPWNMRFLTGVMGLPCGVGGVTMCAWSNVLMEQLNKLQMIASCDKVHVCCCITCWTVAGRSWAGSIVWYNYFSLSLPQHLMFSRTARCLYEMEKRALISFTFRQLHVLVLWWIVWGLKHVCLQARCTCGNAISFLSLVGLNLHQAGWDESGLYTFTAPGVS